MKSIKQLTLLTSTASLTLLLGCGGGDGNSNDNTHNGQGSAPANLSGKLLTVQVTSGTPVFQNHGSYTFLSDNGAGNSGTYHIEGFNDVPSNIGTFTYHKVSD